MVKKIFLAICLASFVAQVSASDAKGDGPAAGAGAGAPVGNLNDWENYQGSYRQLVAQRDAARGLVARLQIELGQALLERNLAIETIGRFETAEALRGTRP